MLTGTYRSTQGACVESCTDSGFQRLEDDINVQIQVRRG